MSSLVTLPLRICLLGRLQVRRGELPVAGLENSKVQELLCYLLVQRGQPHSRDALAALLWPEAPAERARKYLRQALWHLRAALDGGGPEQPKCVAAGADNAVALAADGALWLDLAAFEESFARVQRVRGADLTEEEAEALEAAVGLYRGDLLEGWYQDWCLAERERVQAVYLTMLDKLMAFCEAGRQYEAGLRHGERILQIDPVRESAHRRLMRLHHLAGDRTAALRRYERCVAVLRAELGVRPSRRTAALAEQIRADELDAPGSSSDQPVPQLRPALAPLGDVLSLLRQLRTVLAVVQHEVQQDIQMIEQTLHGGR